MNASPQKVNRNDLCPCQSGKKFKHCCANTELNESSQSTNVQTLLNQARNQAYQQGNFQAAEDSYRKILTLQPNNAEALAGVGQGLFWRNHRAEAKQYMQKAAKQLLRRPEKADVRSLLDLSEQLQLWGDLHLAMQLARAVLKQQPQNPSALYSIVACLHRLNLIDDALVEMQRLLTILPNDAGCQILMALLEIEKKQMDSARERLETVLATEQNLVQKARASLELSKVYEKQKRYSEAFDLMTQAGAIHSQLPNQYQISKSLIFDKLHRHKIGFDHDLLNRWTVKDFTSALPVPIFLIGFLRSGTTLTEQVLSAHPDVVTSDENTLMNEVAHQLETLSGIKDNTPEALRKISLDQAEQLRRYYWERASQEYTSAVMNKRFVNKVALNSIETGLISTLFPEAKILFALRDPRDIVLSCASQSFSPSTGTVNLLSWEGIAKQYAAVMELWLTLRDKIAPEYLELRYEDTVTHFEAVFKQVFALLDLPWNSNVQKFHEKTVGKIVSTPSFSAVAQPIYQTAVARWHGYRDHLKPILPILEPYIAAFGYQ